MVAMPNQVELFEEVGQAAPSVEDITTRHVFRTRLIRTRERLGYRQVDVAKLSGITAPAISHFENGTRMPTSESLKALADALAVSADYLLGRVDDPVSILGPAELLLHYSLLDADGRRAVERMAFTLASLRMEALPRK